MQQLNTMPHPALSLNQVVVVPGVLCKVEAKSVGNQSVKTWATFLGQQLQLRKSPSCEAAGKTDARTRCILRGRQFNVIDAEPAADTTSWRVDPTFLAANGEDLPGWERVTGEGTSVGPSKEVNSRKFGDNVQDTVHVVQLVEGGSAEARKTLVFGDADTAILRSSRHDVQESQKHRSSFHSRPDRSSRWRFYVECVRSRSPIDGSPSAANRCEVILFLESLGLDSTKLMAKYPMLSTCCVENARAVARFLELQKLRRKDVVKVLTNNPDLLAYNVEETFLPVVKFLRTEVGLKERDVGKVVNRCARLLTANVDDRLRPTLRFLRSLGFTQMSIVVSNNATLLASSVENRLIPKMQFLESLGLSKKETVQLLIRFPAIFNYSIASNLQPKYICLVEEMGRGLDDLKAFPQFFGYSLKYRIRPRYQFLNRRNLFLPLADMLKPTDEEFYARFQHDRLMESSPCQSQLDEVVPNCKVCC